MNSEGLEVRNSMVASGFCPEKETRDEVGMVEQRNQGHMVDSLS